MNGRRAIVGLCMLSALLVSAFAAQSASAAEIKQGTTAFTCKSVKTPGPDKTKGFKDEHCKEATENVSPNLSNVKFEHESIANNTTTDLTITNEKASAATTTAPQVLKATISTFPIELESNTVHGEGSLQNLFEEREEGGNKILEHYIHAEKIKLKYSGVVENKAGCAVTGIPGGAGVVETKELTVTSTLLGDSLKFTPKEGTLFAEFELGGVGCKVPGKYKVVGSITCKPTRATITCDHEEVTTQGNLRIGSAAGPKAGLTGKVTVKGKDTTKGDTEFTPLSVTTTNETP